MAQQETYKINVESNAAEVTREVDEAVKDLKQSVDSVNSSASSSLDNVSQSAEKAADNIGKSASGMKDLAEESVDVKEGVDGAVTVLDQFTGGLAGMLVNVTRGFKAFGKTSVASFKASIAGANGLKKALIATGIGALVVAVGLLVAYWDDIVGFISGASAEQKELLAATEATKIAAQDRLTATEGSENSLKLQGKSEREIRDLKIQQTQEVILATKAQLEQQKQMKKAQVEAAERNQKIAAGVIAFLTAPITILLGAVDALTFGLKQVGVLEEATSLAEEYLMDTAALVGFDAEEVEAEADATIKETQDALNKLENQRDGYILANQDADQAAADQASADAKAAADKKEQDEKAAAEKLAALKEEIRKAEANNQEEIRQQELEDTEAYYQNLIQQAIDNGLETEELEKTQAEKLAELKAKYRQEDLDAEQKLEDDKQAIRDKDAEEEQQKFNERIQMVRDGFDAMSAIADAFAGESEEQQRRNFQIQKALSAANVVVGTIEGVQNAYTTAQKSPLTVAFPGYPYVQAGLATAFGIAQLQQIRKSQFQGGGSPTAPSSAGGGAGTAMAGTSPSFNIVGGSGANVIAESLSKTPLKAYVVGSDVTTQQELDRKQIKSATL